MPETSPPASHLPRPVHAAIGLVPTLLDGVRRLPARAAQLPLIALGAAETARREYDELSERGERLVGRLRAGSPPSRPVSVQGSPAGAGHPAAGPAPAAERAKAAPTPSAPEGHVTRVDTAATPDVLEVVEDVARVLAPAGPPPADALPLADYDHLTLGSLRGRLRSLSVDELVALRAYEKSKADRLPVVTMLDNRIAKLAAGDGAPSGGGEPAPARSPRPPRALGEPAPPAPETPPRTKVRHT